MYHNVIAKNADTYKSRSDEVRLKIDSKLAGANTTPVMLLLTSEISCNLETFCINGRFKVPEMLLPSRFLHKRNNIINRVTSMNWSSSFM